MDSLFETSDFEKCRTCKGTREVPAGRTGETRPCPTCTQPPPRARRTDPETSRAAAASIPEGAQRASQEAVLRLLSLHPNGMTDVEIEETYAQFMRTNPFGYPEQSPSGLRTRRHELVTLGMVEDTGEKRPLRSGRLAIVWRAVRTA